MQRRGCAKETKHIKSYPFPIPENKDIPVTATTAARYLKPEYVEIYK
jgi:hypothetical protein